MPLVQFESTSTFAGTEHLRTITLPRPDDIGVRIVAANLKPLRRIWLRTRRAWRVRRCRLCDGHRVVDPRPTAASGTENGLSEVA